MLGLIVGFLVGIYVAWNWWKQPEVIKDIVNFVHRGINVAASSAKQKIKETTKDKTEE